MEIVAAGIALVVFFLILPYALEIISNFKNK